MSRDQWTLIGTLVGAVAAVLAVVWGIYVRVTDRAAVKVTLAIGIAPFMPGLTLLLLITAANTSHHPVTITSAGLQLSNGKSMVVDAGLQVHHCAARLCATSTRRCFH